MKPAWRQRLDANLANLHQNCSDKVVSSDMSAARRSEIDAQTSQYELPKGIVMRWQKAQERLKHAQWTLHSFSREGCYFSCSSGEKKVGKSRSGC